MKKLIGFIFSMELTGILLLLFTISIGYATFVENDFGTLVAKARVYNARWFELMLLLLFINMVGSIVRHKMYAMRKLPIFLFHVSFLIILLGAAVTRYIGYEGLMAIREGKSSNYIRSGKTYIRVWADDGQDKLYHEKAIFALPGEVSKYNKSLSLNTHEIEVEVLEYFVNASEKYAEAEGGEEMLWLVISAGHSGRQDLFLKKGETKNLGTFTYAFEAEFEGEGMNITHREGELYFNASDTIEHMDMTADEGILVLPNTQYPLLAMNLYSNENSSIVLKQHFESALAILTANEDQEGNSGIDAFTALVSVDGQSEKVNVFGGNGFLSRNHEVEINGVEVIINYGSKLIDLPFEIRLEDFHLERYPGSNSPASYSSDVTIIDNENELVMPYKIFMNNVLNYRGYRFFQSSYDRDEMGTILSVNHDAAGTIITYIGYLLMTVGMFITLFIRNSRFRILLRKASSVRQSRKKLLTVVLITSLLAGYTSKALAQENGIVDIPIVKKEHAEAFGKLLVQGMDGRLEPVNTLASEMLRKLARKSSYEGMSPEQVLLGIMAFPQVWNELPLIKVSHPQLRDFLGVEGKYASFSQVVDIASTGQYLISDYVDLAYAKKPSNQTKFDKDVMQVDERVNIYYMVYKGSFLSIFPVPGDVNHTWVTSEEANGLYLDHDSTLAADILHNYIYQVSNAVFSNDWTAADAYLGVIRDLQQNYGREIIPSDSKVKMEIFYNKFDIFKRLSMYFGLIGFILLVLHFVNILKPRINLRLVIRIGSLMIFILFLLQTAGLILRWYISGHAPWSDGYESMIYIAWATTLAGLIFVSRSGITLSVTALMTSLILAVAGMSWMDPEITNLVPVLKSYWLIIHVAIITASYGFLGLGALLGFLNLIIMIMKSKDNYKRLKLTVAELSHIIEMTLIIGLFLLTIGTFLGGVWANESWGRYWGWDPKETWALATVVFYSFVVHMRFIPGLRGHFAFSFASLISYGFVLMTYFGVNYYLSGLHSYASGDPVPVPNFIYYTMLVIAIVSILAFIRDRKLS